MDATGVGRQPSARGRLCQKAHQRLALGRILYPAHRHPQSRKHPGGIGEEAFEAFASQRKPSSRALRSTGE